MRLSLKSFSSFVAMGTLLVPVLASAQGLGLADEIKLNNGLHLGQIKHAEAKSEDRKSEDKEKKAEAKKAAPKLMSLLGTVSAISGSTISLRLTSSTTITVNADDARLIRRFGAAMLITDVQVNDQLFVKGVANGDVVDANLVQNLSLQARNGTFSGTVASLSTTSFVLQSANRGPQTINVTTSTRITKNGEAATFADILVNSNVRVNGVWDRTNENVTAKTVAIRVPMLNIHVSGTISAISGHTLTVMTGATTSTSSTSYSVEAGHALIVFNQYAKTNVKELRVGDQVDVWGKHEASSNTIKASFIRDLSQVSKTRRIVTLADNNSTLRIDVGDRLLLNLGNNIFTWTAATSSNPTVLMPVQNSTNNNQGSYEAKTSGHAELTASGTPRCQTATPACEMPSIMFHLNVEVGQTAVTP